MKRLLSLLLAVGFIASFIGHGWAHSGLIKEDACLLCCAAPGALQARPGVPAPSTPACVELAVLTACPKTGAIAAFPARAPPRA